MNIQKINSFQSFGKTAMLKCSIKNSETENKQSATMYKMDPLNYEDAKDVLYSRHTTPIKKDFLIAQTTREPHNEFFLLKDNETGEVISCAQTSHHYRTDPAKHPGLSTLIEEFSENPKYINAAEPLLAGITKRAQNRFDETVYTAFNLETLPSLKQAKFSKTKLGEFYIPQRRFDTLINQAEKRSQIEYLI